MKKVLFFFCLFFIVYSNIAQIPASGNVLWLQADKGTYIDNGSTPAANGQWIQQWADQSGNANHFSQPVLNRRPELINNVLCSRPVIRFRVGRGTYLQSSLKLSGAKSAFIVFILPSLSSSAGTLLSIKGNNNSYTEIVGTDFSGYHPVSYIADLPGSISGGYMVNSMGNNASFSTAGNMVTMVYDGGANLSASSYAARYDAAAAPVSSATGKFGRLMNDTTTIGARAPEQNINFLEGDIAEIIVYNRALNATEISQVENYLSAKYGLLGTCVTLPVRLLNFEAEMRKTAVRLKWKISGSSDCKEFVVEHSTNQQSWSVAATIVPDEKSFTATNEYAVDHSNYVQGDNFYRLKITGKNGQLTYSEIKKMVPPVAVANSIRVFPNPAVSRINICVPGIEKKNILLTDNKGRILRSTTITGQYKMDIRDLPSGLYFIREYAATGTQTIKFIKQ